MKLLHTADWQLGLRLNFVGGDAAARLRAQRFETIERLAVLARERSVDAVVVAGDVFDDNGVGASTLQQAREALRSFDVPVVLLPGNHDPATEDSALGRLGDLGPHVHVALTEAPIFLDGLEIHPCPLHSRHQYDDSAAHLSARGDSRAVRVAVAHGGAHGFGETVESPNRIDVDAVIAKGFDYLALGDWHGLYRVNERAWYSGALEATRFKEKRPGFALLVEIDAPGAAPRVEELYVAGTHWHQQAFEFGGDQDLDTLEAWLSARSPMSRTLVELDLAGSLSLAGRSRLEALLADYGERLAYLRIDEDRVHAEPSAEDLEALRGDGFVGQAIAVLRDSDDACDADALQLMYRLMQEGAA